MTALLDINLLLALAWPNHVHHEKAQEWFSSFGQPWATCPATQFGFIRVSSNKKAIPEAKSPGEAQSLLQQITGHVHHVFWPDDLQPGSLDWLNWHYVAGHRQVSDLHLLGLAVRHSGRLATLDRSIRRGLEANSQAHNHLLEL